MSFYFKAYLYDNDSTDNGGHCDESSTAEKEHQSEFAAEADVDPPEKLFE